MAKFYKPVNKTLNSHTFQIIGKSVDKVGEVSKKEQADSLYVKLNIKGVKAVLDITKNSNYSITKNIKSNILLARKNKKFKVKIHKLTNVSFGARVLVGTKVIKKKFKRGTLKLYKGSLNKLKGMTTMSYKGIRKGFKSAGKAIENIAIQSRDSGIQAVSTGIKLTKYTYKVTRYTTGLPTQIRKDRLTKINKKQKRLIKKSDRYFNKSKKNFVKNRADRALKQNQKAVKAYNKAQKYGRKAEKLGKKLSGKKVGKLRQKLSKVFRQSGGSFVTAIQNTINQKIIVPLITTIATAFFFTAIIAGAVGVIYALFGGWIDVITWLVGGGSSTETINVQDYLTDKVNEERQDLIDDIIQIHTDNIKPNGSYHYVWIYNNDGSGAAFNKNNIQERIYSTNEYVDLMQPLVNTVLMSEYDMKPSKDELEQAFNDIWSAITEIKTVDKGTQYCNNIDGCGYRHANNYCPNKSSNLVYHNQKYTHQYNHGNCDYYTYSCNGHTHTFTGTQTPNDIGCTDYSIKYTCKGHTETHTFTETQKPSDVGCNNYRIVYTCSGHSNGVHHTFTGTQKPSDIGCTNFQTQYLCKGHSSTHIISGSATPSSVGCTNYSTKYICNGHIHTFTETQTPNDIGCNNYNSVFHCNGFYVCQGHRVLGVTIGKNGMDKLLKKYFTDEIETLETKGASMTQEEKSRLNNLRTNYEYALQCIKNLDTIRALN